MVLFNPSQGVKGSHIFLKSIRKKVNAIAQLGFELAYYYIVVQHVSHYITRKFLSTGQPSRIECIPEEGKKINWQKHFDKSNK